MPEDFEDERRRAPIDFKDVEDVSDEDIRVSVIGTVVDKEGSVLMVDDGTGKLDFNFDMPDDIEDVESGDKVRVVGINRDEGFEGEAIQDFSDFDVELYKEIKDKLDGLRS